MHPDQIPQEVIMQLKFQIATELIRKQQQGLGRSIVSSEIKDCRIVDVGGTSYSSKDWKTFHDFLLYYIKKVMSEDWVDKQSAKPSNERHPIFQWYQQVCIYKDKKRKAPGNVISAPMIGAADAYLQLAYNLYLISHNIINNQCNERLQKRLVDRLKNNESFPGAYYETYVCAVLIKAGFEVDFENETDRSRKHCDFVATHKTCGKKYTVEVKAIRRDGALGARENVTKSSLSQSIRNQLYDALSKPSNDLRIIFVDVNLPDKDDKWSDEVIDYVKEAENLTIKGLSADSAYVILTNNPHHYYPWESDYGHKAVPLGYKIKDFGYSKSYRSLIELYHAEHYHKPITDLLESIHSHQEIPSTFSGEIPFLHFTENKEESLIIGQKYLIPGHEVIGTLVGVTAAIAEKKVYGIYKTGDGQQIIATNPMTIEEMQAYEIYGDAIFGEDKVQFSESNTRYDLFKKLLLTYSGTPKTKLLEWMKESSNIGQLKGLSQSELVEIYCEGISNARVKCS